MPGADENLENEEQNDENQDGNAAGGKTGDGEGKGPKTLDEALGLIASLRKENAKHRTQKKALEETAGKSASELKKVKDALGLSEEDQEDPKTTIANLRKQHEDMQVELSIADLAIENAIPADKKKFFRFLLAEKIEGLEEGTELTDSDVAAVVAEVKGVSGKKQTSTGQGSGRKPDGDGGDAPTVESFAAMTVNDRGAIYDKNPTLYNSLMTQAKAKKLIK